MLAPEAAQSTFQLPLEFVYEGYLSHYRDPRLLTADTASSTGRWPGTTSTPAACAWWLAAATLTP